jgi:hypothetical protein
MHRCDAGFRRWTTCLLRLDGRHVSSSYPRNCFFISFLFSFFLPSLVTTHTREAEKNRMGSAAAQIPTSFGHELRACLRCRLVKTYDQVLFLFFALLLLCTDCCSLGFWTYYLSVKY